MSKSALLKSSIAKKYWMALTGLFLCTFLIGHLIGNLQLIFIWGEEGKRAFNEYAYFMQHNIFIKVLSYVTYISILFHAIDGLMLAVQNSKARPVKYAHNNPGANSSGASRSMALLGSIILIFIVTHMVNFWAKMHFSEMPLHTFEIKAPSGESQRFYHTKTLSAQPIPVDDQIVVKHENQLYLKEVDLKIGEGYKDLHSVVMAFFGQSKPGFPANSMALVATILYVISMAVLGFHLWHGFASAFQSLGLRHKRYTNLVKVVGIGFSVIVPFLFAIIPVLIFIGFVK